MRRVVWGSIALMLALAASASGQPHSESPEAVLEAAFANRYEVDLISEMEIVMRGDGGGEQRRLVQAVSKRIDGRAQSIGRVLEPANLRGLTVLISELADGGREMFVYLPALLRARRISGIQRLDSFLGSDLTYDDFERQRAADFTVESLPDEQVAGERCAMIRAVPRGERAYTAMVLAVAPDRAILEYRYFARGAQTPYRVIETPRARMHSEAGHLLPTFYAVRQPERRSTTELTLRKLAVNPKVDDRIFSVRTLDQQRPLPRVPAPRGGAPGEP
jgi:Outer membrane lipoprotein-sorting protein